MTSYFDYTTDRIADGSIARSAVINAIFDEVSAAFDKIPGETTVKLGTVQYGVDSGVADAYVITLPNIPAAYTDGMQIVFKAVASNTGAATINVNSLGLKSIRSQSGAALSANDIVIGKMVFCVYNSTSGVFEIVGVAGDAAIRAAIATVAALVASSGVKVSSGDTTLGFGSTKIVNSYGAAFQINNPGGNETMTVPVNPVYAAYTGDHTVTALELRNNAVLTNSGAAGEVILSLPAGATGYVARVEVVAAQLLRLKANGSETIRFGADITAAGGYIRCDTQGAIVSARWNGSAWIIFEISEYWRKDV